MLKDMFKLVKDTIKAMLLLDILKQGLIDVLQLLIDISNTKRQRFIINYLIRESKNYE